MCIRKWIFHYVSREATFARSSVSQFPKWWLRKNLTRLTWLKTAGKHDDIVGSDGKLAQRPGVSKRMDRVWVNVGAGFFAGDTPPDIFLIAVQAVLDLIHVGRYTNGCNHWHEIRAIKRLRFAHKFRYFVQNFFNFSYYFKAQWKLVRDISGVIKNSCEFFISQSSFLVSMNIAATLA